MVISLPRKVLGYALLVVALLGGAVAGVAGSLATAAVLSSPALFFGAGLLTAAVVSWLLAFGAAALLGSGARRATAFAAAGGVSATLLVLLGVFLLPPLTSPVDPGSRPLPTGATRWTLETGSEVAVLKKQGQGATQLPPVIFLHGGPGSYSVALAPTVEALSTLTEDGYDIYFYDQVGGGLSARLDDVTEYTLDRHLADLDALIARISRTPVILIGSSFGAALGASYIAKHPDRVAAAVFSGAPALFSPSWQERGDGSLDEKMTPAMRERFSHAIEKPRLFVAIGLATLNPRAAARFAPEAETGAFFDEIANEFYTALTVCPGQAPIVHSDGFGFWSNRMTGISLANREDDPRPRLREVTTPVLMLRGACDYKKEEVAQEYVEVLANARLEHIAGAGHMPYLDGRAQYLAKVRAFLGQHGSPLAPDASTRRGDGP